MIENICVLLIEDDPMVQEVNRQFVERMEGFEVVGVAGNGEEGVQKLKQVEVDLVLLDIYMPRQDGIETIHQIRKEKTDVDVIVITAATDHETIRTMLQNGAVDYIMKPFKFERIQQSLENYQSFRAQFSTEGSMTQKQLDEMMFSGQFSEEGSQEENLPKGLNGLTLKQILLYLVQQSEAKSSEEVAEGVGIARVTARRYLDYLEKEGKVKIDIQYGGVGRPVNRYQMKN